MTKIILPDTCWRPTGKGCPSLEEWVEVNFTEIYTISRGEHLWGKILVAENYWGEHLHAIVEVVEVGAYGRERSRQQIKIRLSEFDLVGDIMLDFKFYDQPIRGRIRDWKKTFTERSFRLWKILGDEPC